MSPEEILEFSKNGKSVDEIVNHISRWMSFTPVEKIRQYVESVVKPKTTIAATGVKSVDRLLYNLSNLSAAGKFDESKHKRDEAGKFSQKEGVTVDIDDELSDTTFTKTRMPDPQKNPYREVEWSKKDAADIAKMRDDIVEEYGEDVVYGHDPIAVIYEAYHENVDQKTFDYSDKLYDASRVGDFRTFGSEEIFMKASDELLQKYGLPIHWDEFQGDGKLPLADGLVLPERDLKRPDTDMSDDQIEQKRTLLKQKLFLGAMEIAFRDNYPKYVDMWHDAVREDSRLKDKIKRSQAFMDLHNEKLYNDWERGDEFYRNTTIEELDDYLETGELGTDTNSYNYVATSPSKEMAKRWRTSKAAERVLITYHASALRDNSAPVRYTLIPKKLGMSKSVNGREDFDTPMDASYYTEQEVRVEEGLPVEGLIKQIQFLDMGEQYHMDGSRRTFKERYTDLEEKYGSLSTGRLEFYDDGRSADSDEHGFDTYDDYIASTGGVGVECIDRLLYLLNNVAAAGKFDESKHKRDDDGKFSKKEGMSAEEPDSVTRSQTTKSESEFDLDNFRNLLDFDDVPYKLDRDFLRQAEDLEKSIDQIVYSNVSKGVNVSLFDNSDIFKSQGITREKLHEVFDTDETPLISKELFHHSTERPQLLNMIAHEREKLVENFPGMARYVELYDEMQKALDIGYKNRYDAADYLYRGTEIQELDSIAREGIGTGGKFPYANFTTDRERAFRFAFPYDNGAIFRVKKDASAKYTTSPGYTMMGEGDSFSGNIEDPQGFDYFYEQEHRIFTDKGSDLEIEVALPEHDPDDEKHTLEYYQKRYPFVKKFHLGGWDD